MLKYLRLPVQFNVLPMLDEISRLPGIQWRMHYNKRHYEGDWTVLALRSPGGDPANIFSIHAGASAERHYQDTVLLQQCPSIQAALNYLQCEKTMVRLMKLDAGAVIKEHTDHDMCYEAGEARFHIPLQTNEQVSFFIEKERIPLQPGDCWYLNLNLPHWVSNQGATDRIHLVIDCLVNDWVHEQFASQGLPVRVERAKETLHSSASRPQALHQEVTITAVTEMPATIHQHSAEDLQLITTCTGFLSDIGIPVLYREIESGSFLPGLLIEDGKMIIDTNKLLYPGDILHEAGHIAVVAPQDRSCLSQESITASAHREAEEMMAIAWSFAACNHLNIDPLLVFHEKGYKGDGQSIVENFRAGRFFGTPMLQWCGMTVEPKHAKPGDTVYPAMKKWLRE